MISVESKTKGVVMDEKDDPPTRNFSAEETTKNPRLNFEARSKEEKEHLSKIVFEPVSFEGF